MSSTFSRLSFVALLVFACACEVQKEGSSVLGDGQGVSETNNNGSDPNFEYNFNDSIKLFSEPILKIFSVQDCQLPVDMPDNIESASIDVTHVRLRSKGNSSGSKWFSKDLSDDPMDFDLGNLGCAVWSNFQKFIPPPGVYDHMRLETVEEGTVVHDDGEELPLVVPSGEQSGIKIFFSPPLVVEFDKITVCIFNYDREKSIQPIPKKNPNRYHFKPVVRIQCSDPIAIPIDDDNGGSSSSDGGGSSSSDGGGSSSSDGGGSSSSDGGGSSSSDGGGSSSSDQSSSSSSECQVEGDVDPGYGCLSDFELPVEDEPGFILLSPER